MELEGISEPDHALKFRTLGIPNAFWEGAAPYFIGALVAFGLWLFFRIFPDFFRQFGPSIGKLFDGALAFSSIMAGFAATLIGILFSIRESKKVKWIEATGKFGTLTRYLKEAAYGNILLAICCVAANCITPTNPGILFWTGLVICTLFALSVVFVWRVISLMSDLL